MNYTDITNKAFFLTSTNSTSFPAANMLLEANAAFDRVTSLIIQADGRWQWDDTNNTDLPIATTDLVANQQDYSLSAVHLELTRAEIKDTNGNWTKLSPIDQTDVYNQSLTDFMKTAGLPFYYDKIAASVFLYPKPNYSQAASLKLYFQRGPNYFVLGDTTKSPGFNSLYHELIPLWIAYNFALANGKENGPGIYTQIQLKEEALIADYALRAKDDHPRLRARTKSYR